MEKITDEELIKLLTKQDTPKITNANTGEVQWVQVDTPSEVEAKEETKAEPNEDIPLQDSLEQDIDFSTIPEMADDNYELLTNPIIERRKELGLNLKPEQLIELSDYVLGKARRPDYLEKFSTDAEGKVKDLAMMVTMIQLDQLPILHGLREQVQERLFTPSNLADMDLATLTSTLNNLNRGISSTLESSVKIIQLLSQTSGLNSKYRTLVDGMLQLTPDKLSKLEEYVFGENDEK